ncbi:MAG: response regulator transcription factor [Richelia sp. RM2_1_2]|nr:response regulator transcription factor [Richelia sp. RM1_1_1]NJO64079.1 response regulator transcription factor [Richelia sp. RM2_1_2]
MAENKEKLGLSIEDAKLVFRDATEEKEDTNDVDIQKPKILIVDNYEIFISGITRLLSYRFENAQIFSDRTVQEALREVAEHSPDLAIIDLYISQKSGTTAEVEHGLGLLKQLMQDYPQLNLMVQSSSIKALVRIKPEIDAHQGGFTIADKSESGETFLTLMEWAMQGFTHAKDLTRGLKSDLEIKPEWLKVLRLAFEEGLQDK